MKSQGSSRMTGRFLTIAGVVLLAGSADLPGKVLTRGLIAVARMPAAQAGEANFGQRDLEIQNTRHYLLERTYIDQVQVTLQQDAQEILSRAHLLIRRLPKTLQIQGLETGVEEAIGSNRSGILANTARSVGFFVPLNGVTFLGAASFVVAAGSLSFNGYANFIANHRERRALSEAEISMYLNDDALNRRADRTVKEVAEIFALTADEMSIFKDQFKEDLIEQILRHRDQLESSSREIQVTLDPLASLEKLRAQGRTFVPERVLSAAREMIREANSQNDSMVRDSMSFQEKLAFHIASLTLLEQVLQKRAGGLSPEAREMIRRSIDSGYRNLKKISAFYDL